MVGSAYRCYLFEGQITSRISNHGVIETLLGLKKKDEENKRPSNGKSFRTADSIERAKFASVGFV